MEQVKQRKGVDMNTNIEVIGIDHGWSQMKTSSYCFNTSIKRLPNEPAFYDNVLEYNGRYYAVGEDRLEVLESKVDNENFYLLTLVAIAKELKSRGKLEADVLIAAGLPLTRFSAERKTFIEYLSQKENVAFSFEQKLYKVHIVNVSVYPQCYAAVAGMLQTFGKKVLVVDVGSWTVDSMLVVNKRPDNSKCDTQNEGLIKCMRATGTFTSNIGQVDTTTGCVYWLTGKEGYQEFVSEQPQADPITAYIKVKTENIGYGEITKTDKSTGKHLAGAVYGIYSDSSCKTLVDTMKTDKNGYAKSKALGAGTYYVKEIDAPNGYVRSNKVHTLMIKAGQTKEIELTDVEQKGSLTIYKEGEVLIGWNGSNFTYEKRKLAGAEFKVTAGADIYCADGTKAYNKGDIVSEGLVTGKDGNAVLSDLHLGTYIVTETRSIDGYTVNGKPKTVTIVYEHQDKTVEYVSTTILNARQKAEVSVIKKDEDTENGLSGGKYTLYADNNIRNYDGKVIVTKGTTLQEITTGAGGKGVYSLDLPVNNNFVIKETQAPANYYRNSKATYSFTFKSMTQDKAKATFSHTFKNKRTTAKIRVTKVDAEIGKQVPQGDALLKGAVYGLYARENIVHPDGVTGVLFKKNELVATLTTDDKGMADIADLYLGKYYVKEISPSEGYLLDETEYDIVCDYEGDMIPQVLRDAKSRERVIKQPFQLIKVSDDGKDTEADLLSGAGFTAYLKSALGKKTDGSYDFVNSKPVVVGKNGATTIYTDAKGYACSLPLPYGTYVVVESVTPHNMETIRPFEVTIRENKPSEPQVWRVFFDREFSAKLRIIKKDSDTGKTVLIPNTEFKIYNMDKKEYVTMVTTYPSKVTHKSFFTDDDGDLILPDVLSVGNYRIEEVSAPQGYILNKFKTIEGKELESVIQERWRLVTNENGIKDATLILFCDTTLGKKGERLISTLRKTLAKVDVISVEKKSSRDYACIIAQNIIDRGIDIQDKESTVKILENTVARDINSVREAIACSEKLAFGADYSVKPPLLTIKATQKFGNNKEVY